ncbi:MAG TPA: hypothetical protein ENI23_02955 [bacterium]|nr:hypothetical protein [bacterium]
MYLTIMGIVALIVLAIFVLLSFFLSSPRKKEDIVNQHLPETAFSDWGLLATGKSGWLQIEQDWLRAMQEVYGVFVEKQSDYGPTNIGTGGEQGVALRSGDKVSRLFELLGIGTRGEESESSNEPRRDAWLDMADYGVIGMLVHDGKWPKMYPGDVWGGEAAYLLLKEIIFNKPVLREQLLMELAEFEIVTTLAEDLDAKEVKVILE